MAVVRQARPKKIGRCSVVRHPGVLDKLKGQQQGVGGDQPAPAIDGVPIPWRNQLLAENRDGGFLAPGLAETTCLRLKRSCRGVNVRDLAGDLPVGFRGGNILELSELQSLGL